MIFYNLQSQIEKDLNRENNFNIRTRTKQFRIKSNLNLYSKEKKFITFIKLVVITYINQQLYIITGLITSIVIYR